MMRVLAFDVGATRLKAATVVDGNVGEVTTRPTRDLSGAAVVDLVVATAAELATSGSIDAIGVAVPGIVDDGTVVSLVGKFEGLVGTDLAGTVSAAAGAPAVVTNDAIAAAVGEAVAGAGVGHRRMVMVTIGTGVGTAVVEDGRPLGAGPWGGGLMGGQIPIGDSRKGPVDTSGHHGTIEALCAADRLLDAELGLTSVPDLLAAWQRREIGAVAVVASYRKSLELALLALAQAHAPSVLVVGGGPLSTATGWLLDGMTEAVSSRLWAGHDLVVVPAALGDAAALAGVAALAVERH
jgi:glucokinase